MRHLATILAILLLSAPCAGADGYPYDLETGREAALLGGGAVLFGGGWWAGRDFRPLTAAEIAGLDRDDVNAFDRGATGRWSPGADKASDIMVYALTAAPVGLMVTEPGSRQGGRLALMYAETMVLSGGATFLIKNLVRRPRPFVYNDDPRIPLELKTSSTARKSFSSGHTANAFASMVFFATVFESLNPDSGARGWVWGGCLAAAGTTGVLRYVAGRHYPTDILAGALVGAAAGLLVPALHEIDPEAPGGGGVNLTFGFAF